nr:hypothetical protein [Pedobacter panaciterrae]
MKEIDLEVGASGIVGSTYAKSLVCKGWVTYGIARNHPNEIEAEIASTHVFITTWMRKEAESIEVNRPMVRNLLNVLSQRKSVQHVALVTGSKHYLGPFEA